MVRCPNCNHEELPGALFCSECGAKLDVHAQTDLSTTRVVKREAFHPSDHSGQLIEQTEPLPTSAPATALEVILHLVDSGRKLPLQDRDEFTLGRVSEGQPLIPEIDLSEFNAYEQGVSRLHAVIGILEDGVTITDLGSANGTWVNGVRVSPHTAHRLNHGDLVTLGTLKIKAIIQS